jgi:hypothetical protein
LMQRVVSASMTYFATMTVYLLKPFSQ